MLLTVFGRRGSGKTTLIRRLIPVQKKPVMVIDVLGNYTEDPWVITYSVEEGLNELQKYVRDPEAHLGIVVVADSNVSRATDYVCSALWKIEGGTLVLDEVDSISVPDAPCFNEAIRYGRNHGIDVITGCRRPAELSKNITAGADVAFVFNTHEPRDLMYYDDFLGEELSAQLPRLPPHHGVYKDFRDGKTGIYRTDRDGKITLLGSIKRKSISREKPDRGGNKKVKQAMDAPTQDEVSDVEATEIEEIDP